MNQEQKTFLINLLKSLTINPSTPEAAKTVEMVQGILVELAK